MDTVCYTLCVATPYILCPLVYFEVSPPPPENPRSAPARVSTLLTLGDSYIYLHLTYDHEQFASFELNNRESYI